MTAKQVHHAGTVRPFSFRTWTQTLQGALGRGAAPQVWQQFWDDMVFDIHKTLSRRKLSAAENQGGTWRQDLDC